jgi:hypothetical protein
MEHGNLDLIREGAQVYVQPVEHFPPGRVGGEVADQGGLSGVGPQLFPYASNDPASFASRTGDEQIGAGLGERHKGPGFMEF